MLHFNEKDITSFAMSIEKIINELKTSNLTEKGPEYQSFVDHLNNFFLKKFVMHVHFFKRLLFSVLDSGINSSILEIGSGYGLNLIILKFLGFENVVGIELMQSMNHNANVMINLAKKYLNFNLDNCYSICGDAESTNFGDKEFEYIISTETISHVPSLDRLMRELNRILRDNGLFILSDGNNHSCPYYKRKMLKIWKQTRNKELEKRIIFLKKHFPDINPHFRASIALHTELLPLAEVENIVPNILQTNKLPMNLYFEGYAPVYSQSGVWAEYGFYPVKLADYFKLYGFSSKIQVYTGSARGFPFNIAEKLINLLPNKIKFLFRPNFIVYSKKIDIPRFLIIDG